MTFYEAAIEVLRLEGRPLHYKKITELALKKSLLDHVGKTPELTMKARLSVQTRPGRIDPMIVRTKPGYFTLTEKAAKDFATEPKKVSKVEKTDKVEEPKNEVKKDKEDKPEKSEKRVEPRKEIEKDNMSNKSDNSEKSERPDRSSKYDKPVKEERPARSLKYDKPVKEERPARPPKYNKPEKSERPARPSKYDKPEKSSRPDNRDHKTYEEKTQNRPDNRMSSKPDYRKNDNTRRDNRFKKDYTDSRKDDSKYNKKYDNKYSSPKRDDIKSHNDQNVSKKYTEKQEKPVVKEKEVRKPKFTKTLPSGYAGIAYKILKSNADNTLISCKKIAEKAMEDKLLPDNTLIPWVSLLAGIVTDNRTRTKNSKKPLFVISEGGFCGLTEWQPIDEADIVLPGVEEPPADIEENIEELSKREYDFVKIQLTRFIKNIGSEFVEKLVESLMVSMGYSEIEMSKDYGDNGSIYTAKVTKGVADYKTAVLVISENELCEKDVIEFREELKDFNVKQGTIFTVMGIESGYMEKINNGNHDAHVTIFSSQEIADQMIKLGFGVKQTNIPIYSLDKKLLYSFID